MIRMLNCRRTTVIATMAGAVTLGACNDLLDTRIPLGNDTASAPNRGFISFDTSPQPDTADATRVDTLTARIDTLFRGVNAAVSFATTLGLFGTGTPVTTVVPDSLGFARALLRAPADSSIAYVTASVAGMSITRSILFVPAYPSRVTLTASALVVPAKDGAFSDLTLTLQRPRGVVSPGGRVQFEIMAPSNAAISPRVSPDSTFATGPTVTARLFFLTSDTGSVTVRATYTRAGHSALVDNVRIQLKAP